MKTYRHPDLILRGRVLALLFLTAVGVTACSLIDAHSKTPAEVTSALEADTTCLIVSSTPEGGNDAPQMELIWGDIDFNGVDHRWSALTDGTTIGYSAQEDTTIWNLPDCY